MRSNFKYIWQMLNIMIYTTNSREIIVYEYDKLVFPVEMHANSFGLKTILSLSQFVCCAFKSCRYQFSFLMFIDSCADFIISCTLIFHHKAIRNLSCQKLHGKRICMGKSCWMTSLALQQECIWISRPLHICAEWIIIIYYLYCTKYIKWSQYWRNHELQNHNETLSGMF